MSHSCPSCGQYCDCDMEDHDQDAPDDCTHCDDDEIYVDDDFGELKDGEQK